MSFGDKRATIEKMSENFEFQETKNEIERQSHVSRKKRAGNKEGENEPTTARGRLAETDQTISDAIEETPLEEKGIHGYLLLLRSAIQEKLERQSPEEDQEEETRAKLLPELITPELMREYKDILAGFKARGEISEKHPNREWISVEGEEIEEKIENWIDGLILEVKAKSPDFQTEDEDELRQSSWMLFQSIGNVLNTKNLQADIRIERAKIEEENIEQKLFKTPAERDAAIAEKLSVRYPFPKEDMALLASGVDAKSEQYNMRILAETVARTWKEYRPDVSKKDIALLSAGQLTASLLEGYTPSLFAKLLPNGGFDLAIFLQYFGLEKLRTVIENRLGVLIDKIELDVKKKINARISDTLFYQEFEFMQEKSQGDIFEVLEEGRDAILELLKDTSTGLAPMLASIIASIGFLSSINPILGGISAASLPAMYYVAKNRKNRFWEIREAGYRERSGYRTQINAMKEGFEEVRTSPDIPAVAEQFNETINTLDNLSYKTSRVSASYSLLEALPQDATSLTAGLVGYAFWREGLAPAGTVLSNMQYANRLQGPMESIVNMYFSRFPDAVQRIQRMEALFGEYESLDTPQGEREKKRLSVSELPNFDISVKDVSFKGILRKTNLDIPQGEFVVVGGRSGAGKTTLLRNMVGLFKPDGGEVRFGGAKTSDIKRFGKGSLYSALAYSNQKPQLFPGMTLRENLTLWRQEPAATEEIEATLRSLNLSDIIPRLDEKATTLSGGELVRFGVARSLLKKPKIMFLDEPTSSLDSQSSQEVRMMLGQIHKAHPEITIVCVSHDEELKRFGDRTVDMSDLQENVPTNGKKKVS